MTKRRTRKTFTLTVVVTAPNWCSAVRARQAVRDQVNDGYFDYYLTGPDYESGRIRAKSVRRAKN